MRLSLSLASLTICALAVPASADTRIKIDTVPSEYSPINSPTTHDSVSLSDYKFEINQETGRARIVANYTYADQMTYGPDDDGGGPRPTIVQLPGLTYDAAANAVVYSADGQRTVCATVYEGSGLFGHHIKVKNTGACSVSAVVANHAEDDGWSIHRFRTLDTYLNVR
jgi:hypothetical protein